MTMDQFNDAMKLLNLRYSIMTCFDLETAATFGIRAADWKKRAAQAERPDVQEKMNGQAKKLFQQMEQAQHNALAGAMQEKDTGPIFETWIDEYSLTDLTTLNQVVKKWQPRLKKYGVELTTY